jgi:catechol 2,3-dioxygenase
MTKPQLKHMGIYVHDIERMERSYTGVFSLTVTDRGKVARLGNRNIVFMSSAADAHHQLVLIDGKDPQSGPSVIFQMSFYLRSLDQLRFVRDQLVLHGATDITPISHGNAWSVYSSDPEGNGLEAYLDTPWHVAQPHGKPFDLSQPNEIIYEQTKAAIQSDPTFLRRSAWMQQHAAQLVH